MHASRLPALIALVVMSIAAPVPWRSSAHADEHHGHVWLPDEHAWDHAHEHDHDGHDHEHAPARPEGPEERGCHCTDEPLATGMTFVVVRPPAHLPAAAAHVRCSSPVRVGAPEVAPSDPGGRRRACEEEPIVLLR